MCHKPGERVSSSMRGCADVAIEYDDPDDLQEKIQARLWKSEL